MPAIDDDLGPGDVAPGVRDEQQKRAVKVRGLAEPALRDAPHHRLPGLGREEVAVDVGLDITRAERVHTDPVARPFERERARQLHDPRLGRCIGRDPARHPQPEDVLLLVEVSDTTIGTDKDEKLSAYGRAGIAEVWLVNLNDLTVEVYREPHFTGFATKTLLRRGEVARPKACPEVGIDVAELLRR